MSGHKIPTVGYSLHSDGRPHITRTFAALASAEASAHAYGTLRDVVALMADHTNTAIAEAARIEAARLNDSAEEHENDADALREEILDRGYGVEDYDAWATAKAAGPKVGTK